MYITRFVCKAGHDEEYYYHNEEDAKKHMMLFQDDDSDLYIKIVVCDEQDNVLHRLNFS